jgi:hypothetical protein
MSSLTTISSGTEEFLEVEELVDTRLSLVIGAGSPQHPPGQPQLPPTEKEASAGRKRKRASTVKGGSDINDDSGGSGARKKLQLTGEQAAAMEKSFRAHNVLSHVCQLLLLDRPLLHMKRNLHARSYMLSINLHVFYSDVNVS